MKCQREYPTVFFLLTYLEFLCPFLSWCMKLFLEQLTDYLHAKCSIGAHMCQLVQTSLVFSVCRCWSRYSGLGWDHDHIQRPPVWTCELTCWSLFKKKCIFLTACLHFVCLFRLYLSWLHNRDCGKGTLAGFYTVRSEIWFMTFPPDALRCVTWFLCSQDVDCHTEQAERGTRSAGSPVQDPPCRRPHRSATTVSFTCANKTFEMYCW